MRYLFNIALLCSIFIMSSFSSKAVSGLPEIGKYNTLHIHADIMNGVKADIMIFSFDAENCAWVKTYDKTDSKTLRKILDPTVNHQIWFTNPETGYCKVLFIDAGDPGPWFKPMDIDMNDLSFTYGRLYQDPDNPTDYQLAKVDRSYTNVCDCEIPIDLTAGVRNDF